MSISQDIDLTDFTTLRLPARAPFFARLEIEVDLPELLAFTNERQLYVVMLGQGSNVTLGALPDTLVIQNAILGIEKQHEDQDHALVRVGAGVLWDELVAWAVERGFSGAESLSHIPGTVGAAPVQNIGAYGQELSNILHLVEAYDTQTHAFVSLDNHHCDFSYRNSIFKKQPGRFFVTHVILKFNKKQYPGIPDYKDLREFFEQNGNSDPSLAEIRNATIMIRDRKLPDWKTDPNVGSFFKNPYVSIERASALKEEFPGIPLYEGSNEGEKKTSAAWLIEQAGFKGFTSGNFGMSDKHALVLVHHGQGTFEELQAFVATIRNTVQEKFGILLEQEPIEHSFV